MNCPNCGNKIQENQKFCTICGKEINNNSVQKEIEPKITKKHKLFLIICLILPIVSVIVFLFFAYINNIQNSDFKNLNCKHYQEYSIDNEKSASGYLQCMLDEKISYLNDEYKFKEQDEIWENISLIIEHSFENKIKYQNRQPQLIGKYNTMDKIYLAYYKEYTLYQLGEIALGLLENIGPDYMYGEGTWEKYFESTKSSNSDFAKLTNQEQIILAQKIHKEAEYLLDKFKNDYFKKAYITELMGIEHNATNENAKKILQDTIEKVDIIYQQVKLHEEKETWEKVAQHIYFDTKSLKITDTYREGYFKIYKSINPIEDFNFDIIENNPIYVICKINIDSSNNIYFEEFEYFDNNNISVYAIYPRAFGEEKYYDCKNGQVYYNALFK